MTCQLVDELIPAYVLGALSPQERDAVALHLAACHEHEALLSELSGTALLLNQEPQERQPSLQLKARIMAAALEPAPLPAIDPTSSRPRVARWWLPRPNWGAVFSLRGAVAALSLAVVALLVWNLAMQFSRPHEADAFVRYMGNDQAHAWVYFVEKVGVITVQGLDSPPSGETYQAWAETDGQTISLGLLDVTAQGQGFILLSHHVTRSEPVFVTLEPAGGAQQPSGAVVLSTERSTTD